MRLKKEPRSRIWVQIGIKLFTAIQVLQWAEYIVSTNCTGLSGDHCSRRWARVLSCNQEIGMNCVFVTCVVELTVSNNNVLPIASGSKRLGIPNGGAVCVRLLGRIMRSCPEIPSATIPGL